MYPSRLNLLSPEKKKYLLQMINYQFIKGVCELILMVITLITISIIGAQFTLEKYFISLTDSINIINNHQSGVSQEIKDINKAVLQFNNIQKEYTLWTPIISQITAATPDGIILSSLDLNADGKLYTFSGMADDREQLLLLQKKLQALDFIQKIEIPLSELTQKENFPFTFTAQIK